MSCIEIIDSCFLKVKSKLVRYLLFCIFDIDVTGENIEEIGENIPNSFTSSPARITVPSDNFILTGIVVLEAFVVRKLLLYSTPYFLMKSPLFI